MLDFYKDYCKMWDWFSELITQALHDNNVLRAYYFLKVVCPLITTGVNNKLQQEADNITIRR